MTLLQWTYMLFLLTVVGGGTLFFAYLLPKRNYPLGLVITHLGLAAITLIFFTIAVFH
ncbi:hypothetical protein [Sulfobacillus sp. hq2]|uniref:hypothetical protein n=1 Tax=Sulfobacillus TaxID=28033 RepID=UPI001304997C|nr:hypothetical protein [Sulfobacillus sp. hq2]